MCAGLVTHLRRCTCRPCRTWCRSSPVRRRRAACLCSTGTCVLAPDARGHNHTTTRPRKHASTQPPKYASTQPNHPQTTVTSTNDGHDRRTATPSTNHGHENGGWGCRAVTHAAQKEPASIHPQLPSPYSGQQGPAPGNRQPATPAVAAGTATAPVEDGGQYQVGTVSNDATTRPANASPANTTPSPGALLMS